MQDQILQLQNQVDTLQKQLVEIERGQNYVFGGNLEDMLVERLIPADLTGVPADNTLLLDITSPATVLNFPSRIMIFKWKGQRLAIPVYDATEIIYPS